MNQYLKSCISLTAESRLLTACFAATSAAAHPTLRRYKTLLSAFAWLLGDSNVFLSSTALVCSVIQLPFVLSCIDHLKSDILDLSSKILHLADRRKPIADSAFVLHSQRHTPVFPLCNAQIAVAAAMTEPTAALGGSSRASRPPMTHFQRLLPSFPPAIAAALLPLPTQTFASSASLAPLAIRIGLDLCPG